MDTHQPQAAAHTKANRRTQTDGLREFLIFRLGAESYGIDLLKVQEIRGYEVPTAIAVDDRMLILLDIEKLMTGADMALIDPALL
jgi:chemotaxis signal transduction protein